MGQAVLAIDTRHKIAMLRVHFICAFWTPAPVIAHRFLSVRHQDQACDYHSFLELSFSLGGIRLSALDASMIAVKLGNVILMQLDHRLAASVSSGRILINCAV